MTLALASIAAIVLLGWLVLVRPARVPRGAAIIDLRPLAATRGADLPAETPATVLRRNGATRILLPIGSEGSYTGEVLLTAGGRPLAEGVGETSIEDHNVVLNLSINLGKLKTGQYVLALRRNGAEWAYYHFELK
jgi:hypothetical protein